MNIDFIVLEKATPPAATGWSTIALLIIIAFIIYGVYTLYGNKKSSTETIAKNRDLNNLNVNKIITKVICMIGGLVGVAIGAHTIYTDKQALFGYNYEAPLTDHEMGVIILIVISAIVFIAGAIISAYND